MKNYVYKEGHTWYAVYANPENPALSDLFGPWEKQFPTKKAAEDFLASLVYPTTKKAEKTETTVKAKKVLTEEQKAKKAARAKARREARKAQANV